MTLKLKQCCCGLLIGASAFTVQAQSNLLQDVTVAFTAYYQAPNVVNSTGTNYFVGQFFFGTKTLIQAISATGTFNSGDILARATPVTNTVVYTTNLVAVSFTNLLLTNISTSLGAVSNVVLFGSTSNYIDNGNLAFGTNILDVKGTNVTAGTNTATVISGTNAGLTFDIGTNTTVTTTVLTNSVGQVTGTNYAFFINALAVSPSSTNVLGTPFWAIYNPKSTPALTPISTNTYFDIHTAVVYGDTNQLADIHGETVAKNGVIKSGITDEIRVLVLTNSIWHIRLQGYSHGHDVPVSLGGGVTATSHDYSWPGNGSGTTTNSTVVVMDGDVTEDYFKLLK